MRATLMMTLLVPVLATQTQAEIPKNLENFSLEKFTGIWYVLAIATEAKKYLLRERKIGAVVVQALKKGQLKIMYAHDSNDSPNFKDLKKILDSISINLQLKVIHKFSTRTLESNATVWLDCRGDVHTKRNNAALRKRMHRPQGCQLYNIILKEDLKKSMFRNTVKGIRDFRVLSTDYWVYAVVYIKGGKAGYYYNNVLLCSREKMVKIEMLQEFIKMCQTVGLICNKTIFLKQDGKDVKAQLTAQSGNSSGPKEVFSVSYTIILSLFFKFNFFNQ